ncbi:MAG: extracellular solute-binding protein family 1, partial [Caproiciproducens sp.]|nr:extracellular solute-binding protein family 1 [Caproiciproducens sp.]
TASKTGSASAASQSAPEDKKVSVKLGIWPEDTLTEDVKMHEGFVTEFKKTHPNVEIVPSYYKYATDTFVSLASSGKLPTVFETWYTEPQKLIAGGFVADITDILKEKNWPDQMNDSIQKLLSKDGRIYGIPRDGYALGLMLNVDMFKAAGLVDDKGYPIYPKTWDELAVTAQKIKQKTGEAGFCLLGKDNAAGWHFSNIAWEDLKWKYDCLTADPTKEDWASGFVNLGTGTAAMYIGANDAVNQPTQVNKLPIKDLSIVPIPAGPKGQYSLSGGTPYMFAKNATKEEISAALDYIEIMGKSPMTSDNALKGMEADAKSRVSKGVPVLPIFPAWTDPTFLAANKKITEENSNVDMKLYQNYFDTIAKAGNLHFEEVGSAQDLYSELTKVIQAVVTDKNTDVPKMMAAANANYQKLLDEKVNK